MKDFDGWTTGPHGRTAAPVGCFWSAVDNAWTKELNLYNRPQWQGWFGIKDEWSVLMCINVSNSFTKKAEC